MFYSVAKLCLTLCEPMDYSMPGLPVFLPHPGVCPNACPLGRWYHPTISSPSPFAFNLSHIRIFSSESFLHIRWPKYWSFSFSIIPTYEYSRLISFRINWFDLLAAKGLSRAFFKSNNSSALSLLYGPTLTSVIIIIIILFWITRNRENTLRIALRIRIKNKV